MGGAEAARFYYACLCPYSLPVRRQNRRLVTPSPSSASVKKKVLVLISDSSASGTLESAELCVILALPVSESKYTDYYR